VNVATAVFCEEPAAVIATETLTDAGALNIVTAAVVPTAKKVTT